MRKIAREIEIAGIIVGRFKMIEYIINVTNFNNF